MKKILFIGDIEDRIHLEVFGKTWKGSKKDLDYSVFTDEVPSSDEKYDLICIPYRGYDPGFIKKIESYAKTNNIPILTRESSGLENIIPIFENEKVIDAINRILFYHLLNPN